MSVAPNPHPHNRQQPLGPPPPDTPPLDWDVMCRVVDNLGDLGVCWRLARRLAALGQRVRLWVDDARPLRWMAPLGAPGVTVQPWRALRADERPGDVVVETFGGDLPDGWLERMARSTPPPRWIDVEYLSAEPYVARSHGLPSPQSHGPGAGLTRWFFYPGFTPSTGGLLLEPEDAAQATPPTCAPDHAEARAALQSIGLADLAARADDDAPAGALAVPTISLFCYEQPALPMWLAHWQQQPTRLLVTPGLAAAQVASQLGCGTEPGTVVQRGALSARFLPWLSQPAYDQLLRGCDLNHVRGEDSLVRAVWAGRPFVWQAYRQHDDAHLVKLRAFVADHLQGAGPALAPTLQRRFAEWNLPPDAQPDRDALALAPPAWPETAAWPAHARQRSEALRAQMAQHGDLGLRLYRFARAER